MGSYIVAEVTFPNKTVIGLIKQFSNHRYWKGTTLKAKAKKISEILYEMPKWNDANLHTAHMFC